MIVQEESLPRWDLAPFFSAPDSPEFEQAFAAFVREVEALAGLQERYSVRRRESADVDAGFVAAFEEVTAAWNALQDRQRVLAAYLRLHNNYRRSGRFRASLAVPAQHAVGHGRQTLYPLCRMGRHK